MRVILLFIMGVLIGCHGSGIRHEEVYLPTYVQQMTVGLIRGGSIYCGGVWVGENKIITANHCIDSELMSLGEVTYVTFDGILGVGKVVKRLLGEDLALLETEMSHHYVVVSSSFRVGDRVHIVGHPIGLGWSYTVGIISAHRGEYIQVSAPIFFGNSGGGAFNEAGELVGISSFMLRGVGIGFFVDGESIEKIIRD